MQKMKKEDQNGTLPIKAIMEELKKKRDVKKKIARSLQGERERGKHGEDPEKAM